MNPLAIGILVVTGVFAVFVLLKSRYSLAGNEGAREARARFSEAKARARAAVNNPSARAQALRDAALVALKDLHRPNLAASYARRAARAAPDDPESIRVAALAMRRAHRYAALEKLLWRRLDREVGCEVTFTELLALYEGPMKRPAQARVLRALWAHRPSTPPPADVSAGEST